MALASYGVTAAGYRAPRGDELLQILKDSMDSAMGVPLDYSPDTPDGAWVAVVAAMCADLSEGALQQLADALDINNAAGQLLENLCLLTGLGRQGASPSQAELTPTLSAGSGFVPQGTRFSTDPATGAAYSVWTAVEDTTLTGAPGEVIIVRAEELGQVPANIGTIIRILDPVVNVSAVTNASAAALGRLEQKDNELRRSRLRLLQAGGRGPLGAIVAASAQALPVGSFVGGVENTSSVDITVDGKPVAAHGHAIVTYPTPAAADAERLRLAIAQTRPAGGRSSGDNSAAVFDPERGSNVTVAFYVADELPVAVVVTLGALEDGYSAGEVGPAANEALQAYFAELAVGDDVRMLRVQQTLAEVPGLLSATVTLDNGGGPVATDIPVGVFHLAILDGGEATIL